MSADRTQQRIDQLSAMADDAVSGENLDFVRKCLADRSPAVVRKAAWLVGTRRITGLMPDVLQQLDALLALPAARDKGCIAKTALANALAELDCPESDVLVAAARYVQSEPVYGGQVDTAGELRVAAASALFRTGYRDMLYVLTDLLADADPVCRRAAIGGLEQLVSESSELLLRLHVLHGEDDPALAGECLNALMRINPGKSLEFVEPFLRGEDELLAETAALALGESRVSGALGALLEEWERRIGSPLRERFMLPIALTKEDDAYGFLLKQLNEAAPPLAEAALRALKVFDDWGTRRDRMCEIVKQRGDQALYDTWFDEFGEELE